MSNILENISISDGKDTLIMFINAHGNIYMGIQRIYPDGKEPCKVSFIS